MAQQLCCSVCKQEADAEPCCMRMGIGRTFLKKNGAVTLYVTAS
ncbi:hypothetical protein [Lacticaseibacillus thailandensis]|nr:hypothetical protein [Lacticaseibacillus thailandensis]